MDRATEHLPKDEPIVVITPSYEGKPSDNGKKFVSWLESSSDATLLNGVKFAVFGVGNSEWYNTYHAIPKLVDELLPKLGTERLQPAGFVNVKEDIVGPWEDWKEEFVSSISGHGTDALKGEGLKVSIEKPDAAAKLGGEEISFGTVKKNDIIAGIDVGPEKRHMEVELPEDTSYRTG
jgi:cytochrome P450/NADPH-cytochrome P450 reductase